MTLAWNGPETVSGQVVALGIFSTGPTGVSYWVANQAISLTSGQDSVVDLALASPPLTHLTGTVDVPADYTIRYLQIGYRMAASGSFVGVVNQLTSNPSFDYVVPQLAFAGSELCVIAGGSPATIQSVRCGVGATNVALTLQPAPTFSQPAGGVTVSRSAAFSWSAFADGIYDLDLEPSQVSANTPQIHVFSSSTSEKWPDGAPIGVVFANQMNYRCTIGAWGPYATIDDAVGPAGLSIAVGGERRTGVSAPIDVTIGP
jgi:hypothetical protein